MKHDFRAVLFDLDGTLAESRLDFDAIRAEIGLLPGLPILEQLAGVDPAERARAALLLDYDEAVTAAVAALKARGFNSPYLRNFVVARTNPLRFIKGEPPPLEELLPSMAKRARGIDASKIKSEDLARAGGAPEGTE